MSRLVSLAAGTVLDCSPPDTVSVAAAAGFDGSGVWVEPATWTDAVAREVRRRLDDTGLVAVDVEVARLGPDGDLDGVRRLLDAGAAVGARNALVIGLDPDHGRTAAMFAEACEEAADRGLRLALEPMLFMKVRTLSEAVAVVQAAGHPAGGVLVDALHLARYGATPADVAAVDPHLLPYAQLCDAVAASPPPEGLVEEALDGRLLPGEGELPLVELLDALPPEAAISVEMRSKALREGHPHPAERAAVVARATRSLPGLSSADRRAEGEA